MQGLHIGKQEWGIKAIMACMLACLMCPSCVTEEHGVNLPSKQEEARMFTLTLKIPGVSVPASYALSLQDENRIQTVDILVFKVTENGEFLREYIPVDGVADVESSSNMKQVRIALKDYDARLVVLANARKLFTDGLVSSLEGAIALGNIGKDEIIEHLVFGYSKPFGAGQAGEAVLSFPMSGESQVIPQTADTINEIDMKRSLCRIDIGVDIANTSGSFAQDFKLDSVFVFNVKNQGYATSGYISGNISDAPHIPANAKPNAEPFGYKFEVNNTKGLRLMERNIYITEDDQNSATPTLLVIKAAYKSEAALYYRIDLLGGTGKFSPFLRNYRYRVNITGITGSGYRTALSAAASVAVLNSDVEKENLP